MVLDQGQDDSWKDSMSLSFWEDEGVDGYLPSGVVGVARGWRLRGPLRGLRKGPMETC